jgi:hypothetical protein
MVSSAENSEQFGTQWKGLYKTASICAIIVMILIPVQIAIYLLLPPPATIPEIFALFQNNYLQGLVNTDLLMVISNILMVPLYLAIYAAVRNAGRSMTLIALVLGLVGIAAYMTSTISFEMLSLSGQYASANTDVQRTALLGAGQALLAHYQGTAFNVYYVLNAITLLLFSIVMMRSSIFSKSTAYWGIITAVLMIIPASAGMIGIIFSLLSLLPTMVWLSLLIKRLLQLTLIQ